MSSLDECWETYWKIGRRDLDASKTLFNTEKYPQALFNLQQSVEKLVKAVFLITVRYLYSDNFDNLSNALSDCEILRKQQLKKLTLENLCEELPRAFGHNPTKKYLKFLVCVFSLYYDQYYSKMIPDRSERDKKVEDTLKGFKSILEEPERILSSFTPEVVLNKILEIERLKNYPSSDDLSSYPFKNLPKESFEKIAKFFWEVMNMFLDFSEVIWLGILFESDNVSSWTRYPTDGKTPLELTQGKMLEFRFPELLETTDRLYNLPENVRHIVNIFKESIPMFRVVFKELMKQQKIEE